MTFPGNLTINSSVFLYFEGKIQNLKISIQGTTFLLTWPSYSTSKQKTGNQCNLFSWNFSLTKGRLKIYRTNLPVKKILVSHKNRQWETLQEARSVVDSSHSHVMNWLVKSLSISQPSRSSSRTVQQLLRSFQEFFRFLAFGEIDSSH